MSETVEQLIVLVKDANQKLKDLLEIKDKMLNMTKDLDTDDFKKLVSSNEEFLKLSEEFETLNEEYEL